ncbi:MAG: hypothetical protein FJ121_11555 [Deltaproteobacteria bacterium]|nr:hypothetical protein [Deltaproteobacteria bacterium]
MELAKEILQIVVSWPMVAIVTVIVLRKPIKSLVDRLILSESGKAKVGPIEIELGKLAKKGEKVMTDLSRLNQLMGESRLLELEITEGKFGPFFNDEQRRRMQEHIEELKKLTADS